jgi:hypothetical protein
MLDSNTEEVFFNDSDIEEILEDREVKVVEPVGSLEAISACLVQDEAAGCKWYAFIHRNCFKRLLSRSLSYMNSIRVQDY